MRFESSSEALAYWRGWLAGKSREDLKGIAEAACAWFEHEQPWEFGEFKKETIEWIMGNDPNATPGGLLHFLATLDRCPGCSRWMARGDLDISECLCDVCERAGRRRLARGTS